MAGMIAGCITVTGLASKLISGVVALSSKIPNPTLSLLLALFFDHALAGKDCLCGRWGHSVDVSVRSMPVM